MYTILYRQHTHIYTHCEHVTIAFNTHTHTHLQMLDAQQLLLTAIKWFQCRSTDRCENALELTDVFFYFKWWTTDLAVPGHAVCIRSLSQNRYVNWVIGPAKVWFIRCKMQWKTLYYLAVFTTFQLSQPTSLSYFSEKCTAVVSPPRRQHPLIVHG